MGINALFRISNILKEYLWIDIQNANLAGIHNLMNGVDLGAIQVSVIFPVFKKTATFDVSFHLAARHKQVHLPRLLIHLGFTRCVCPEGQKGLINISTANNQIYTFYFFQLSTFLIFQCHFWMVLSWLVVSYRVELLKLFVNNYNNII